MTHHHMSFMAHSHSMAHHHHHSVTASHHHHHSPRHHHHHHHHRHRDHNDVIIPIGILPLMTTVNASNSRPKPPVGEKSLLIPKEAGETSSLISKEDGETSCSKLFTFCLWLMALVFIIYLIGLVASFIAQA